MQAVRSAPSVTIPLTPQTRSVLAQNALLELENGGYSSPFAPQLAGKIAQSMLQRQRETSLGTVVDGFDLDKDSAMGGLSPRSGNPFYHEVR